MQANLHGKYDGARPRPGDQATQLRTYDRQSGETSTRHRQPVDHPQHLRQPACDLRRHQHFRNSSGCFFRCFCRLIFDDRLASTTPHDTRSRIPAQLRLVEMQHAGVPRASRLHWCDCLRPYSWLWSGETPLRFAYDDVGRRCRFRWTSKTSASRPLRGERWFARRSARPINSNAHASTHCSVTLTISIAKFSPLARPYHCRCRCRIPHSVSGAECGRRYAQTFTRV